MAQTGCLWSIWESIVNCVSLATGVNQRKRGRGHIVCYCDYTQTRHLQTVREEEEGKEGGREERVSGESQGKEGEREKYTWRVRRRGKGRERERAANT